MMDNFEKHIKTNTSEFDTHKADRAKLWANIEAQLDVPVKKTKTIRLWHSNFMKIAAVIVIAFGLFGVLHLASNNDFANTQNNMANQELNDIDMHYQGLVAYQVKLVNNSEQLTIEEKKEFLSFMDELDVEYKTLKIELLENVNSERVLEAIVLNYKKRIEIIENLLSLINDSKKTDHNHEYIL
ncbi:MAG: hypothetical protein ABJK28_08090 [Algibacter sp.]